MNTIDTGTGIIHTIEAITATQEATVDTIEVPEPIEHTTVPEPITETTLLHHAAAELRTHQEPVLTADIKQG